MQSPEPYREERPWGEFVEFAKNAPTTVKIITVRAGEAFSLQKHAERDELWYVISGSGTITRNTEKIPVVSGATHFIPRGTLHRIEATLADVKILEVAFGTFDENDIIRLEDRYQRT